VENTLEEPKVRSAGPLPTAYAGAGRNPKRRRVQALVKDLHTYLGLLNFSHLIVFGIAGLVATFSPPPGERQPEPGPVRHVAFTARPDWTDKEVADAVYEALRLPLTGPVPEWAIRRDAEGRLLLNFHTVNGPFRVTVLESEGRLRIETLRNGFWRYVSNLHATLRVHDHSGDWRVGLWTWYVEVALWSLIAMALSGLYLWLSSRPRFRTAFWLLLGGSALFIVLYVLTR
jgi:hypothetical protein